VLFLKVFFCNKFLNICEELKGSVQRDLKGVKIGLKKSIIKSYITKKISFFNLKKRHHERSIKLVSES
jgi:hypothetical protein